MTRRLISQKPRPLIALDAGDAAVYGESTCRPIPVALWFQGCDSGCRPDDKHRLRLSSTIVRISARRNARRSGGAYLAVHTCRARMHARPHARVYGTVCMRALTRRREKEQGREKGKGREIERGRESEQTEA